jgi:lipoate-protein ligase A
MSPLRELSYPRETVRTWVDRALTCAEQIRTDEDLLRAGTPGVRVAVLTDRAVSVGVGLGRSSDAVLRARDRGLNVVRRGSGGTAVLHDVGDLAWTVILPRGDPIVGREYARQYDRLGAGAVRFLEAHDVAGAWVPPPGLSPDYCLLGSRGQVLASGDRILGGAAQHVTGSALLHHGILPRSLDRPVLSRAFDLTGANGLDRLTSLEELGLTDAPEVLAPELARALSDELARPRGVSARGL